MIRRPRQHQPLFCTGHRDIRHAALFIEGFRRAFTIDVPKAPVVRQYQERESNNVHKPPLKAFGLVDGHDLHSIHGTRRLSKLPQLPATKA